LSKEAKEVAIEKVQGALERNSKQKQLIEAAEFVGGISAVHRISQCLASQAIRAMEKMQEAKGHEAFGYTRFDDFLDQHPGSPMNSSKYYRQRDLLYKEGDLVFDAMQTIGIPANTRKLLGKGEIAIDGEEIVVGSHRMPLSDTQGIKAVLQDLAFQSEKQAKKVSDLEKDIKATKAKLVETVKAASKAKPDKEAGTPFGQALLMVLVAMNELAKEVGELDQDELRAQQDNCLSRIGEKTKEIMEAFKLQTAPPLKASKGKGAIDVDELDDELFDE